MIAYKCTHCGQVLCTHADSMVFCKCKTVGIDTVRIAFHEEGDYKLIEVEDNKITDEEIDRKMRDWIEARD